MNPLQVFFVWLGLTPVTPNAFIFATLDPSIILTWSILGVLGALFLAGCVWRISYVDPDRSPRRD